MAVSRGRTAATLSVLAVLLVMMVVYGWKQATAAFPGSSDSSASDTASCANPQTTTTITSKQVTVSVYNASGRKGLADRTMGALEANGFKVGALGNAPEGTGTVDYVEVRVSSADDPAAALVAQQFKPPAKVVPAEDDLGPGPDVFMGKGSKKAKGGPRQMKLAKPVTTCLDKPAKTPSS